MVRHGEIFLSAAAIQQVIGSDPYCGSVSVAFMSELDDPDLA
jgi:hypothetical protein